MFRPLLALALVASLFGSPGERVTAPIHSVFTQQRLSDCGEDAPDGLIVHLSYDAEGKVSQPPLTLFNPATGESSPIPIDDAGEAFSAHYKCLVFVKSVFGAHVLLDLSNGITYPLDFLPREEEWEYYEWAYWDVIGERRYALFQNEQDDVILFDLERMVYSDLSPLAGENGQMRIGAFSPSGNYLTISAGPLIQELQWLVPTADPSEARPISQPQFSSIDGFDASEERFIFLTFSQTGRSLYLEDVATGESRVIATDPDEVDEYSPYLTGWFIPGEDDLIAVLHHDRFALVDISGTEPEELWVIEGSRNWSSFTPSPDGKSGVLDGKPETIYIDLESGATRPLTTPEGTGIQNVTAYGEYGIATLGIVDEPTLGYGLVELNTGEVSTIYMLGEGESFEHASNAWAEDGRIVMLTVADANQHLQMYLVNNEAGTMTPVADAAQISVTLSPDGNWAAFSARDEVGPGPKPDLQLLNTATGEITPLQPGSYPVWVGP